MAGQSWENYRISTSMHLPECLFSTLWYGWHKPKGDEFTWYITKRAWREGERKGEMGNHLIAYGTYWSSVLALQFTWVEKLPLHSLNLNGLLEFTVTILLLNGCFTKLFLEPGGLILSCHPIPCPKPETLSYAFLFSEQPADRYLNISDQHLLSSVVSLLPQKGL